MNKKDMIVALAQKTNLTQKQVATVIDAYMGIVSEQLMNGDKVSFVGFGTFSVKAIAARSTRNPRTGETINCPAKNQPIFKPGKQLKESLNK